MLHSDSIELLSGTESNITYIFNNRSNNSLLMTTPNSSLNFENLIFDPFKSGSTLLDNLSDPDSNLFNKNLQNLNTSY